jgi:ribosomal protein S18 acetylase RimI-like enzyme
MDLYRLHKTDVGAAADALAGAFLEDGLVRLICPEAEERKAAILPVFRFSAGMAVKAGEAWASSPAIEGVVLWLYSWKMFCPPWRWLVLGGLEIRRRLSAEGYRMLTNVSDRIDRARMSVAPEQFLYLSCLGVQPEFRRRGLARELVQGRVRAAAAGGLPTFVETNTPGALEFYKSVGFKVLKSFRAAEMDYYILEFPV